MKRIDLKVEPVKNVSEESFKPYGQIFGLEKGKPTEDFSFLKCWRKNIDIGLTDKDKIGYDYCTARRITNEEVAEAKKKNLLPEWLKNFKGDEIVNIMERHPNTTQTFFFLEGDAIFVIAPADASKSTPDISKVRAFLFDTNLSISISKGIWHWPPIPVQDKTRFCMVCSGNLNDSDRVDLDVEFKLVY